MNNRTTPAASICDGSRFDFRVVSVSVIVVFPICLHVKRKAGLPPDLVTKKKHYFYICLIIKCL